MKNGMSLRPLSCERKALTFALNASAETFVERLLAYFRTQNEKFDKRVGINRKAGSATVYRRAFKHLSRFLAEKYRLSDIPFSALDRSFIEKYDLHLRMDCGLAQGSIVLNTVRLGTIINCAIADGIITANPFAGYKRMYPAPKQKYSTNSNNSRRNFHATQTRAVVQRNTTTVRPNK